MYEVDASSGSLLVTVLAGLVLLYFATRFLCCGGSGSGTATSGQKDGGGHSSSTVNGPKLFIFFGSQTGTAQRYAQKLAKDGRRNGFNAHAVDLSEFEIMDLANEEQAIFCIASYGEGEPTDNARDSFEYLLEKASPEELSGLRFTLFSLGDRTYKHYQQAGRQFNQRLLELGATALYPMGEGDAHTTLEEDFEDWRNKMWPAFCQQFGLEASMGDDFATISYELVESTESVAQLRPFPRSDIFSQRAPFWGRVISNRELMEDPGEENRSTIHVEIETPSNLMKYQAGDHLGVMPANQEDLVMAYAAELGLLDTLDVVYNVNKVDPEEERSLFPLRRVSMRNVLTWYLDLTNPVNKETLAVLSMYAKDPSEQAHLKLLSSHTDEGKTAYQAEIRSNYTILLEVLKENPSLKGNIKLVHLLQVIPKMQPRFYSIASDYRAGASRVGVGVAVVKNVSPKGREALGVCSSFLQRSKPGDEVPIFIRTSNFHLPANLSTPTVMIGPGTGVAPFIGFLERRKVLLGEMPSGCQPGPCVLFFGCRNRKEDYIYQDVLQKHLEEGVLTDLQLAFSRETKNKVYVQHKLRENEGALVQYLEAGGAIFVCGDARFMAKDVDKTLNDIIQRNFKMSEEEAEAFIQKLSSEGRYLRDVWSPPS